MAKLVETAHYHLWTDALHARALARQSRNRWDRGSYVRWAIIVVCTVLEASCSDALDEPGVTRQFKKSVSKALSERGLTKVEWGAGLWAEVIRLRDSRHAFVHANVARDALFQEVADADNAIEVVRRAVIDIYGRAKKSPPTWIHDDEDQGWDVAPFGRAFGTVTHADAEGVAEPLRITYEFEGREHTAEICAFRPEYHSMLDELVERLRVPATAVRAYHGSKLIFERILRTRGS